MNCNVPAAAEAFSHAEANTFFSHSLSAATGILVAVSGGPDSMALLALLAQWNDGKIPLFAATVDHGLRQESVDEAALVAAFARGVSVSHTTLEWLGSKPAAGIQNAARNARYALLVDHAKQIGCSHLVTAHHADDQAETILMRLIAGSGVQGLAGMRIEVVRDGIVHSRPFLSVPKVRLVATCVARGLPFVSDPSNSNERYGRTRVRRILLELQAEGLTSERLCKLGSRAAQAQDALGEITHRVLADLTIKTTDCVTQFQWDDIASQPTDIRLRTLTEVIHRASSAGGPLKLERVEVLLAEIDLAFAQKMRIRRSIADCIITLQRHGLLTLTTAPNRNRGRKARAGTVVDL